MVGQLAQRVFNAAGQHTSGVTSCISPAPDQSTYAIQRHPDDDERRASKPMHVDVSRT